MQIENTEAGLNQEAKGNATLEGDKYLVNIFGSTQLFDGQKVITIVPDNEEVTIEEKTEEDNALTPSNMLTFYQDGHTAKWDIKQNVNGRSIQYVKLIPMDSDSEVKHILVGVDATTKHIYKVIEIGKDQTKTTITVDSFKINEAISKSLFNFDATKYEEQGYYIINN